MVFERRPCIAFLLVLALLLFTAPCRAQDALPGPDGLPAITPVISVNDSPPEPPPLELPIPAVLVNDSPDAASTVPSNDSAGIIPDPGCPAPSYYTVTGTIYTVSGGERQPWADGHLRVYVNGVQAEVEAATYSATISPADGIDVELVHDCGYLLGRSSGTADPATGTARIDVEAPALEISGDVYADDRPAVGACLFVYLNDRPYGPIAATYGQGPMFSLAIPGGHPGDRVSITASENGLSGIVSQDVSDYRAFLTVNLRGTATYLPYTARSEALTEEGRLTAWPRRPQFDDRFWLKKCL